MKSRRLTNGGYYNYRRYKLKLDDNGVAYRYNENVDDGVWEWAGDSIQEAENDCDELLKLLHDLIGAVRQ